MKFGTTPHALTQENALPHFLNERALVKFNSYLSKISSIRSDEVVRDTHLQSEYRMLCSEFGKPQILPSVEDEIFSKKKLQPLFVVVDSRCESYKEAVERARNLVPILLRNHAVKQASLANLWHLFAFQQTLIESVQHGDSGARCFLSSRYVVAPGLLRRKERTEKMYVPLLEVTSSRPSILNREYSGVLPESLAVMFVL